MGTDWFREYVEDTGSHVSSAATLLPSSSEIEDTNELYNTVQRAEVEESSDGLPLITATTLGMLVLIWLSRIHRKETTGKANETAGGSGCLQDEGDTSYRSGS
jgi:hypothetical protein